MSLTSIELSSRFKLILFSCAFIFLFFFIGILTATKTSAATINVTTTEDGSVSGQCTLRDAIQAANTDLAVNGCVAGLGIDKIQMGTGVYTIASANNPFSLQSDIYLCGTGPSNTFLDGNNVSEVINAGISIPNAIQLNINICGLTIQNGYTPNSLHSGAGGGAFFDKNTNVIIQNTVIKNNKSETSGGGIESYGSLTINDSLIDSNTTGAEGAGISIGSATTKNYVFDRVTVINNTIFDGNSIYKRLGAGIFHNGGSLSIKNATIAKNTINNFNDPLNYLVGAAGGLYSEYGSGDKVEIINTTFLDNLGKNINGVPAYEFANTLAIQNNGTPSSNATMKNTIIAGTHGNCGYFNGIISLGGNIETGNTCSFMNSSSDKLLTNPLLSSTLSSNGAVGPVLTYALNSDSPAINTGSDCSTLLIDARRALRDNQCDRGAFELNASPILDPLNCPSPTVATSTDLSITKTDNKILVTSGSQNIYIVKVHNNGGDVVGAKVNDTMPAEFKNVNWACAVSPVETGNACPASGTGNIDATIDLKNGADAIFTVTGTVDNDSGLTNKLINTAVVTAPNTVTEVDPTNNTATDSDDINRIADISITKTDNKTSIVAGSENIYQIVITNNGPTTANPSIIDALPSSFTITSFTCTIDGLSCNTIPVYFFGDYFFSINNLKGEKSAIVNITGTVDENRVLGVMTNRVQATVGTGLIDSNLLNNNASDETTVVAPTTTELSITKTDGKDTIYSGENNTYTIIVKNNGFSVKNATVIDVLPVELVNANWTCTASIGAKCSQASGNGSINTKVDLIKNAEVTFKITGKVDHYVTKSLLLSNIATVTAPVGITDTNTANNTATDQTTLFSGTDLSITKTDNKTTTPAGYNNTYVITITNNGTDDASGVYIEDTYPSFFTITNWTCQITTGTGGCAGATSYNENGTFGIVGMVINRGAVATITINGYFSGAATGILANKVVTNIVAAENGVPDIDESNNTAIDTTQAVAPVASVSVTKTDDKTQIFAGSIDRYSIIVSNNSSNVPVRVHVKDVVPAEFEYSNWTCSPQTGVSYCDESIQNPYAGPGNVDSIITLNSEATLKFTVTGKLKASATGIVTNTVTATVLDVIDPNPLDNTATDTTTIIKPQTNITVTKTDNKISTSNGLLNTYVIKVTNTGPDDVQVDNIRLVDVIPAQLKNVTWTCTYLSSTCPAGSGTGNLDVTFSIYKKDGYTTFTVTGLVDGVDTMVNTARITVPEYYTDNILDNTAVDETDIVIPVVDFTVTKTDNRTQVEKDSINTYTIKVTNNSDFDVTGVKVYDVLPPQLSKATWTNDKNQNGTGNINDIVNIKARETVTYTVKALVVGAVGDTIYNSVNVDLGDTFNEMNYSNNTAFDMTTITKPAADIEITNTDDKTNILHGTVNTYIIKVKNLGPSNVQNVSVTDILPTTLKDSIWACGVTPIGQGNCTANNLGNINAIATLDVGATATFTLKATVNMPDGGLLLNTAKVTLPTSVTDINTANNSATDTTTVTNPSTCSLNPVQVYTTLKNPNFVMVNKNNQTLFIDGLSDDKLEFRTIADSPTDQFPFGNVAGYRYTGDINEQSNPNIHPKPAETAFINGFAFTANYGTNTIGVTNFTDFNAATILEPVATDPLPQTLTTTGNYIVVGTKNSVQLFYFDSSTSFKPILQSQVTLGNANSIFAQGKNIYVVTNDGKFVTHELVETAGAPSTLVQKSVKTYGGRLNSIVVENGFAYIVKDQELNNQLITLNVTNSSNPVQISTININDTPTSIVKQDKYVYVTTFGSYGGKLQIIDVSNTSAPRILKTITTGGGLKAGRYPIQVAVFNNYAYVVDYTDNTLSVYNTQCYISTYGN